MKLSQAFTQGVIVNILNPKTALFFLAFLPQFVNPARGSVASQCVVLGCMFSFLGALTDSLWAVLGGTLGKWVGGRVNSTRFPRYFAGSVYIGLGIAAAVSGPGKK